MTLATKQLDRPHSLLGIQKRGPLSSVAFVIFSAVLWFGGQTNPLCAATSVSQYGFTWTFSQDRTVGQFCNGDWWVLGPVTITSITPADTDPNDGVDMHGTLVNPGNWSYSGWDSRTQQDLYRVSSNKAKNLPLTVENNSSVLSCKSFTAIAIGNAPQMELIAILTVLPTEPPAGSFRPPYFGPTKVTDWVKWNKSKLDYTKLRNLPVVGSPPTFAEMEGYYEHTLIHLWPNWNSTYLHPALHDNPGYGREISSKIGRAALLLNLNYTNAQKEKLLIGIVQRGIDIYGISVNGGGFDADGGHNSGRKLPMLMAGLVLNDSAILARANSFFAEDRQHFYVAQADVDLPRKIDADYREPYTAAMIGTPEWSANHYGMPEYAGANWGIPYRNVCGSGNVGMALAARIMGLQTTWNCPAFFDYMDRYYSIEAGAGRVSYATNYIHPFVAAMWQAYRGDGGVVTPPIEPPVVTFAVGDRIETTRSTNVRDSAALSGALLGTQALGATGTILEGPVLMDSITWWKVNYATGADGWSGGDNFIKSSAQPTPPVAPSGLKVVPD